LTAPATFRTLRCNRDRGGARWKKSCSSPPVAWRSSR